MRITLARRRADLMSDRYPPSIGILNGLVLRLAGTIAAFLHSLCEYSRGEQMACASLRSREIAGPSSHSSECLLVLAQGAR